jgi:hypothetical protein
MIRESRTQTHDISRFALAAECELRILIDEPREVFIAAKPSKYLFREIVVVSHKLS